MNGSVVVCCFKELVRARLGDSGWERILFMSGVPKGTKFSPVEEMPAEVVVEVLQNTCKALGITIAQAAEMFGEFWAASYAERIYHNFGIAPANSREFISKLNDIHAKIFRAMDLGTPPRFRIRWKDANSLTLTLDAGWDNIVFFIGIVKGIGRYYEEDLNISVWSSNKMLVCFPAEDPLVMALEEREAYQNKA